MQVKGPNTDWESMNNVWGASWESTSVPMPPLDFRIQDDAGVEVSHRSPKDLSPPQSLGSVKDCASRALCPHQASRVHELLHLQVLTNVCCSLQCLLMCWRKVGVQLQCFLGCKLQHALQICVRHRPDVRAQVIDFVPAVHCTLPEEH